MTVPLSSARQVTFCADPADSISEKGIIKGNIELPIIDDLHTKIPKAPNYSRPTSADHSSPIYGSRSALHRFKEECRTKRLNVPQHSIADDSYDLDILSDVGIAYDDSDSDVVPVITPLSLSARKKVRKEPRIKVPSSKVDNSEPTIHEETTQDIIESEVRLKFKDVPNAANSSQRPRQIRSNTVIVDNPVIASNRERQGDVKNILSDRDVIYNIPEHKDDVDGRFKTNKNSNVNYNGKVIKKNNRSIKGTDNSVQFDVNPKVTLSDTNKNKNYLNSHSVNNSEKGSTQSVREDKSVISTKYDKEIKPNLKSKDKGSTDQTKSTKKQRPRSSGDERKKVQNSKQTPLRRVSEHNNPPRKHPHEKDETPSNLNSRQLRSRSAEVPPPETPIISDVFGAKNNYPVAVPVDENERVSGIPKRKGFQSNSNTPRGDFVLTGDSLNHLQKKLVPPFTPKDMATSDGYDYESETFEEILQERNAMVKAERTYQRRIKQLEEELNGMIKQCQALSDENKELRKTVEGLRKKNQETEKSVENNEDAVSQATRIAKLETEKEDLIKTNEKLTLSLKENESKKKQINNVLLENTRIKNKNSELEKKVQSLEQEIEGLNSRLKELNLNHTGRSNVADFKLTEMEVNLQQQKQENEKLTVKVASLQKEKKALASTLDEKRTELNEVLRAMQTETVTESEFKNSKERLENAQNEVDSVREEMAEMRRMLQEADAHKEKLRYVISQKEAEVKKVKSDQEHKDRVITDLRHSVEKAKEEIQKHENAKNHSKELEKETNALKSRIGSLKAEIECSLEENQKLKKDRDEVNFELSRLRNENAAATDAVTESKRFFRKWENEREMRNKAEVELAKKQEEIENLEARVKDGGNKLNVLYSRLRALEDDRMRYKGPNGQELETNNKILTDENKKLRQMLVERNIELTNKQNENDRMTTRMDTLERKQKDADFKVVQLSGWVSSLDGDSAREESGGVNGVGGDGGRGGGAGGNSNKKHLPPRYPKGSSSNASGGPQGHKVGEPQIAFVSPRSRKRGAKRNNHHSMTPPPGWEKPNNRNDRADSEHSNHTPLSLPLIDSKSLTPPDRNSGYFLLYKEKLRRLQERRS